MTLRDYREIRVGDVLRHPDRWAWGCVTSFAPNGRPHVRRLDGKYRIDQYRLQTFPLNSIVCHLYEYDSHVREWRFLSEITAFRKRIGRDRFNRVLRLIGRQSRKRAVAT